MTNQAEINTTNVILAELLKVMQSSQEEQRAATVETRENNVKMRVNNAKIMKLLQVSNEAPDDAIETADEIERRRRDETWNEECSRAELRRIETSLAASRERVKISEVNLSEVNRELLDSELEGDGSDNEDNEDDEYRDWPEEEEEDDFHDEEFHDKSKCKKERKKLRNKVKKLTNKVMKVEKDMENMKKVVHSLSRTNIQSATIATNVANVSNATNVANVSYAKTSQQNTCNFPTLGAAKNLQNIYKTPNVAQIQRPKPVIQSEQDRIEEEFFNASSQIGFKPITFDHIKKEKSKLDVVEKLMDEKAQLDIVSKKLIAEFLRRELAIPVAEVENIVSQIETIHPPVTTEPNTWDILYVKFTSNNIVNRIWSYAPQLPKDTPEDQIKTELRKYIPPTLYENYKAVESAAYEQRRQNRMQTKVLIGKDRFILKIRPKDGQKEPWKNIPEFLINNLPKIQMSPRPRVLIQPERRTPTYSNKTTSNTTLAPQSITAPAVEKSTISSTQSVSTITKNTDKNGAQETPEIVELMDTIETNPENKKHQLSPEEQGVNKVARIRTTPTNDIGEKQESQMTAFAVPPPPSKRSSINTSRKTTPKKNPQISPRQETPKKKKLTVEEAAKRKSLMTKRTPNKQ